MLKERPFCEACEIWAEFDGKVTFRRRRSEDPHEIKSRGRGGSITNEENILMVCRICHNRITGEPETAKKLGLLDNSWDEDRGPREHPRTDTPEAHQG